ncbi:MAG: hypothetical protein ABJB11_14055 [Ferruginibacter sp.]
MKICIAVVICMLLSVCMNGQSLNESYFPTNFASIVNTSTKVSATVSIVDFSSSPMMIDSLATKPYNNAWYLQKSRAQQFNGIVLIAGGSLIGAMGLHYGFNHIYDEMDDIKNGNDYKFEKSSCTRLAVTGLVLIAGSIPYFISALRNKNKVGLKLTCQKTSFGASAKACKKVTSLTFGIPIGR